MKLRQGNVFTPVCHSIHRGVCVSATPLGQTSPGQIPPMHAGIHTPPLPSGCWDTVNKRAVRILLECILVEIMQALLKYCLSV